MVAKVLTLPIPKPAWWKGNPTSPTPKVLGDCPACGTRVTALAGSPWRRPHLMAAVPCMCWLTVDEANELENGAWE